MSLELDAFAAPPADRAATRLQPHVVPGRFYRGLVGGLLVVLPFWAAVGRALLHLA